MVKEDNTKLIDKPKKGDRQENSERGDKQEDSKQQDNKKYRAPALDKGLDILEFLASSSEGMSKTEIAKGVGRSPNETYRMLSTLTERKYVTASSAGDKFMLSLKLLVLANRHPPQKRLVNIAEPLMQRLTQEGKQSCQLALWQDGNVVISSSISAPGNWRMTVRTGAMIGLYNTGSGLALAAFQTPETRQQMIREHFLVEGEQKSPDVDYWRELDAIRTAGYARLASRTITGVTNLSFPILDTLGNAIAALTCPYIQHLDDPHAPSEDDLCRMLADITKEIGAQISGF